MVRCFFFFFFFFNYGLCDDEGGRERKEKVGGGLRWPERQWWSEWVVMGSANY